MRELLLSAGCAILAATILFESANLMNSAIRAPQTRVNTVRGGGRRGDDPLWELPWLFDDEPQR